MMKDTLFACITLTLAIAVGFFVFRYPLESSYFVCAVVIFLFCMGMFSLVQFTLFRSKRVAAQTAVQRVEGRGFLQSVALVFFAVGAYVIAIRIVNYEIATVVFFVVTVFALGFRHILRAIFLALVVCALLYLLFFHLLAIARPESVFFS